MNTLEYIPHLSLAALVRFVGVDQPRNGQLCTIIRVLPNPSKRQEHQWYDVRFTDGSLARFLEKHLVPVSNEKVDAA